MALLQTLQDPFNQVTLNGTVWTQFTAGSATMSYDATGAKITYPASSTSSTDGDITSVSAFDLTGSFAYMQILNTLTGTSNDSNLTLRSPDSSNLYQWQLEGGSLFAERIKAGVQTNIGSVIFSAVTHKYWRISNLVGTTISWDTSTDGVTWTPRFTFTNNLTITAVKINIAALSFGVDASAGNFKFNNFNIIPATGVTLAPPSMSMMGVGG